MSSSSSSSLSSSSSKASSSFIALTVTTSLFFAINFAMIYYELLSHDNGQYIKIKNKRITPKKKLCNASSSSSLSSCPNELNTPQSLNIDDIDFGSALKTTDKKPMNNTNALIDDLENIVNEMNEKDLHLNIQKYTNNSYQKESNLSIEITSPNMKDFENDFEKDMEDQIIMAISPNREVEKIFDFNSSYINKNNNNNDDDNNNNNNNNEEENNRMSTLMTPDTSFMMLPSPVNISTVKSKSRKNAQLSTTRSQSNTPMSVLSPLTIDNSLNYCHESDLLTPETIRSEFEESKIIGFSAIKQLPMELMDYSLDSDFGQGSDVEESPVKPIRNSTMTKITRNTKATLMTGPTPVPYFKNFNGMDIENINQNICK